MKTKAKLLPVGALLTLFAAGAVSARRGGSPKENVAIHRRQAQQQSSSVPITITPQNVALMQVVIGGQTLQLEPDTGSYDLWVTSTEATTPAPPNQTLFDPTKSTTFKALPGDSLTISYGDGTSLSGGVGADTVQLGSLAVMGQPVGLPSNYQEGLQTGSDGILGLGPDSTNLLQPAGQKTFLQNLEPILAQPLFAVNFNSPTAGSIDFGAIDTTQFTGTLTNVTVESTQHLWQVAVSDVSAGGKSLGSAGGQVASIDTGSNAIFLPQPVVAAYYATIPQASGELQDGIEAWVMPCTTTPTDLTITINNNYQAVVPGSNLDFIRTNATHCAGGVMDVAFGGGDMALGLPFLKAQYVVFDLGQTPQLRMAPINPQGGAQGGAGGQTGDAQAAAPAAGTPADSTQAGGTQAGAADAVQGGISAQPLAQPAAQPVAQEAAQPAAQPVAQAAQAPATNFNVARKRWRPKVAVERADSL